MESAEAMQNRIIDLTEALTDLLEASEEWENIGLREAQSRAHILLSDSQWKTDD